jgi:hypothetical protein
MHLKRKLLINCFHELYNLIVFVKHQSSVFAELAAQMNKRLLRLVNIVNNFLRDSCSCGTVIVVLRPLHVLDVLVRWQFSFLYLVLDIFSVLSVK